MWATLKKMVADALRVGLPGVVVTTVKTAETPDVDTVIVSRGATAERPLFPQQSGTETLLLECWTWHKTDDDAADRQLQTLETNVMAVLRALPRVDPIVNITITSITPDDDLFRPSVGSQLSITINWRALRA